MPKPEIASKSRPRPSFWFENAPLVVGGGDRRDVPCALVCDLKFERIRRGERIEHYETVRLRKDGSLIDISLSVSPIKDAGGKVIGASKIARDISERKQAQARQDMLTRELHHRTKNLFAVVQSVVSRSFAGTSP
jgi:hypothetical protein